MIRVIRIRMLKYYVVKSFFSELGTAVAALAVGSSAWVMA